VATNDGSAGKKGFVTALFDQVDWDPVSTFIYTCGPVAMMRAVQEFARGKKIRGQAAAEEVMACGLGACLGCSIMTTKGYKTVCHDGPVFGLDEIIWGQTPAKCCH
jgi:dihydroorotate dehydrogenase electron transfer subunit